MPKGFAGKQVLDAVLKATATCAAACLEERLASKAAEVPEGWRNWSLQASSRDMTQVTNVFFSDPEKGVRVQRLSKSLEEKAAALEAASFHTLHGCEALGQEIVQPAIENTRDAAKDCRAFVIVMNGLNLIRRAPKWNKQKLQDSGMNSGTGVLPDLLVSSPATSPDSNLFETSAGGVWASYPSNHLSGDAY